jgi:hypothetical protein
MFQAEQATTSMKHGPAKVERAAKNLSESVREKSY